MPKPKKKDLLEQVAGKIVDVDRLAAEQKIVADLTRQRDERVVPVVRELINRIAKSSAKFPMGDTTDKEKAMKFYQDFYVSDIYPIISTNDLYINDMPFLFAVMHQVIDALTNITNNTFYMVRNAKEAKFYGVKDLDMLKVEDIFKK